MQFSSEIGRGNFTVTAPRIKTAEIGSLAKTMDIMRLDLRRNQKQKEEMLAQIAHEIRNPLGSIELMANLTKEDILAGNNNPKYLNKILLEISDLKTLITAYLNYSRPYLAKPEKVDFNHLVNEINSLFNEQFSKKKIQFDTNIQSDKILFDPGHLKQILINLISNSIESISKRGQIKLECVYVEENLQIKISDTGAGIASKDLNNVFNPFFTNKKNGTGLGLAICKKLCLQNNATIEINRNPKSSCEFIISKRNVNNA